MLRPATDDDQHHVRTWRNHPEVRAVSLTRHEIGEAEHAAWWASTKTRDDRLVLIYERHDVPSGVVTFFDLDRAARTSWWGYYLDNAGLTARGELLPAWIEIQRQAIRYAWNELGLDVLDAEVLDANEAVRSMNRRNGFAEIGSEVRDLDGEPTTVWHIQARSPRTRAS
jgi:UDP-4-amino-4,6-dideoxy-N-acetyl-beta-L-altrosamine N-acetyltransferase